MKESFLEHLLQSVSQSSQYGNATSNTLEQQQNIKDGGGSHCL